MKKTITFSKTGTSYIARRLENEKKSPLKILFLAAGASASDKEGFFTINGIDDMNEDEMLLIYMHKDAIDNLDIPRALQNCKVRTILPCKQPVGERLKTRPLNGERTFDRCSIEILKFGSGQELDSTEEANILPAAGMEGTFCGCSSLHTVFPINIKAVSNISDDTFEECAALQEIRLYGLNATINLTHSPLVSYKSILYAITNSCNKISIDFAVHPDTYRYIQTLKEAPSKIGGTTTEWNTLHTKAVKKNIHFSTTEFIVFVNKQTLCLNNVNIEQGTLKLQENMVTIDGDTMIFN